MQSSCAAAIVAGGPLRSEPATSTNLSWIVCNAPPMPAPMQAGLSGAATAASCAATASDGVASSASACPPCAPSAFHLLDLGECRLGAIRTCVILLSNLSDTRAECTLNYTSAAGTVSVEPRQLQIAPRQSMPITIRVQARQLNPSYHKQIVIENTQHPGNALLLMVRCNNTLDRHGAAFHNLFYHILNPADTARRMASDLQASPPPPLLPVGFRETAAGKIKREEPQQEEQIESAGVPSGATTTDDEAASSGRNSARRHRKGSTASTGSRGGADDEIEDLLANVEDDSDLLPPPPIDMEPTATRSSEHSTATSPLPVSPPTSMDASAVLTQQSLYQQQLLLQSNSCSTTPSLHTTAAASAAVAAGAAECVRNSASPVPPPQPTNVIQLGTLVCNHPIMRAIDVKNITSSRLRLRLHTPLDPDRFSTAAAAASQLSGAPVPPVPCVPEEFVLYVKNEAKFAQAAMELASDGSMAPRITPFSPSTLSSVYSPSSAHSTSTLGSFVPFSLGSPMSAQQNAQQPPVVPQSVLDSWCRFESVCVSGEHSAVYSHFADVAAERAYVKKFIMQQRDMEIVLREQMLVRLHEAEAQVAAELGIPPSGKNELVLAPFETKRIFVYLHMQSRLAVPPLASGAAPPSLTFLSKDFQRNRIIKLEEKELRARDAQLYTILGLNPHASALPTLDRRRQLTDLLANNVDGSSSTVTSPVLPADPSQPLPEFAFPVQGSPPVASPSSQPPIPESSPASAGASLVPPLTSSSSTSSAAPGLKIFFELVEFPQALSMGAPQPSPSATQMATQQAMRIDIPPIPAPLLLPSPISGSSGLSADLYDLLQLQQSGSTESGRAVIEGAKSPPRSLAVSIPDALVPYSETVTPALSSAAASPAIGCSAAPVRSLLLPAYLCRSSLEVAQQHINFGQLLNMHVHSKSLVLSNLSEVPLLFMVRQTGSIASLDLTFPRGDIGVIPALGYSDLPFLFKPSLAGKFLEPITILNVQDRADERVINVKAYLRKPVHFWIQNLHMDFKVCCAMGLGAAGWNVTPARPQPQGSMQQTSLQRSTSMQALQRSSSLPPSASVGHLAALAHSFVAPAVPITSSHQRIVVKNISLKARTFKIKLVEWERTAIKLKRRAPISANNVATDEASNNQSNDADNSQIPRLASPHAMTLHAPRPPPLATADSPSPMSPRATTNAAFTSGIDSSAAPPPAGVSLTPESPVMPIETYLSADPLPPGLVPLPAPSLSLKLEDVALSCSSLSAFEREEEEEALNHKLRIAIRKKKTDKIERIRNRLSELRDMRMDQRDMASVTSNKEGDVTNADGSATSSSAAGDGKDAANKMHDSTEGIIFTLEPNAVQNVRATLMSVLNAAAAAAPPSLPPTAPSTPSSKAQGASAGDYSVPFSWVELYTGVFHVYETKNKEIIKEVKCSVALASDLQTQEEWRMDSAAWMASDAAEEAATLEEEDEQDADAQADKNELEQDEQAHLRTDDAATLNSPRSSKTVPDSEAMLPPDLQFMRSQSLPTEQLSEVPQLGEQSFSFSALDTARSCAELDATPSSGNASDGYRSPAGSSATPTTPPTSGSTGALAPVVPSAAMQQQLMQCASSMLLPASMLSALYLPHSFPLYVPAPSSATQLALSARSHASFFHMLNAHARQLMSGGNPSAMSVPDVASILALTPINTRSHRGPLIPFEAYIPLEFSTLPALPSAESQSLSSRSRSMPAAHRFSASLKQQEQQASAAAASSYPSPMRLMSGTAASIFRVYIENQVPLSLPSPSFFTLCSHVPTPMIIEVKWIPDVQSSQPLSHSESQQHALGYNATHGGMAFGRSSSQSVGQAPPTLPIVSGVRADSDVPGGYMRVFVKPGTALLAQPNRSAEASLPSAAAPRSRTAASVVHRLPSRSQSHYIGHAPTPSSASLNTCVPGVSLPPPSQSLFLFLPAHGELDVFMCWLASLLSAIDHVAPSPVVHRRTLRRSSSSIGSVGGSGNYPFVSVETQPSSPESNTGHTHRFKKAIALADRTVMAEAVLAPAPPDPEDAAAGTSPTSPDGHSSSGSFKKQAPTLSSVGGGKPNPSLRARAGAIYRSSTLVPGQFAHLQSMAGPPAPSLPRGQLLIRPVGFPSIRSMLGVEVCSVSGTAAQQTQVSPLMLTPERIHAGVVLVDMQSTAGADSSIPRSLDARRPSRSGVSSALLWSSSSHAGVVRGRFVIYNSTTAATRSGSTSSAGRVSVIFGSQSKSTLTSQFVPSHQSATFQFKPARAVIPANDRRIIDFQCHVRTLGHQTHGILVRDVTNDIDIALPVTFTAKEPVYVRFEDCKDEQFDVGLIYAQVASPTTTSIPSPSSRPVEQRWSSRFSKLVPFRVRNVREYDVRVRVASNCTSEMHVFDGEGDIQKSRRCLSCAGGFCSAVDPSCLPPTHTDVNDPPSIVDAQPSCPSSVVIRSNSTRTLLLAFTPTMSVSSSDGDSTRDFVGGLSFFVFPHRSAANFTAHPLPTTTQRGLSHSASEPQFMPPLARSSSIQRGFVRFTEEDGTASVVAHGFGDDISEYDDDMASDSTNDSARPGAVRRRSVASSTDTEEEDQDEEHGIGSVVSTVAHSPADLATDRCLAELNVRVFGRVGISVFKLEPVVGLVEPQTELRPVLHKMETLHNRVSTIDFFVLNRVQDVGSEDADAPPQPPPQPQDSQPPQPLRYSVRLSNLSSLLPLCFRLEASSPNVAMNVSSGCLAPLSSDGCCPSASSIVLDLSLSCPEQGAGQVQEWLSVLVAQQATVDYQRLEEQKHKQQSCTDPHHSPNCRDSSHAASSSPIDSTPQPPSLPHQVVDLLGVREELLHTVFLRCFTGVDDSSSSAALRSPHLHLDVPPFSPLPPHEMPDESMPADFGSVYVPDDTQQPRDEGEEGEGGGNKAAAWGDADLVLPALAPAVSRKVAKQKLLESILNPASASGAGSNGAGGVGSGLSSPVSPYG